MAEFLLPTYGFGDVLTAYRPDPSSILTKSVDSSVSNSQTSFTGSYLPSISRDASGNIVLSGYTQDSTGKIVPVPGVVLDTFKRFELLPSDSVPGGIPPAPAPSGAMKQAASGGPLSKLSMKRTDVGSLAGKVKAQLSGTNWKKILAGAAVVYIAYRVLR